MRQTESTGPDDQEWERRFHQVTGSIVRGALVFPPPFDLATSAALAVNDETGDIAERLFEITAQKHSKFRVLITEIADGVDDQEVINTTVTGQQLLITLLDEFINELAEQLEKGDPSGG